MSESVTPERKPQRRPATMPPPRQMHLPFAAAPESEAPPARLQKSDRVFVNRNLQLSNIEWLGFDMDYTLAIYHQRALDELSVQLTLERLLRKGYPGYLKNLHYDTHFPIRGLLVDKQRGNILKMDRFKAIHKGYHGLTELDRKQLHKLYHSGPLRPHTERYHWIDTLFSLSEVTSYAAIVDALEKHEKQLDYPKIFQDVRDSIDAAHRDGDFYAHVTQQLSRYVRPDPLLERTLHKFRSAGKKIFLLTNSPWSYTSTLMQHILGAEDSDYPSWQHYFDIVIVAAQKPVWFSGERPFLQRTEGGLQPTRELERGAIYEGGNLKDFERMLDIQGPSVLYVGDHIYGDILRSKKESIWRTAMIIQELDQELAAQKACASRFSRILELEAARDHVEDELRFYQSRHRQHVKEAEGASDGPRTLRAIDELRRELRNIDAQHQRQSAFVDRAFHPYWGSILKEAGEMSSFGAQVETYSDVYMSRVSSLLHYSPLQHYRSPRDLMPHEL